MSRTRTVERRKEREQQKKRQRQTVIIISIVVVAVVLVGLFLLTQQPAEAPIPAEAVARYEGIPQSTTDDGFPVLGNDDAPVKVLEYASFDCTHCREFHDSAMSGLVQRVRNGEVQFTYVPLSGTGSITNGLGAARTAICAGQQGKFWEFHDALFSWQGLYANTAFSDQRLKTGLTNAGIDRGQWDQCMASSTPQTIMDSALRASQLQNITGTPSLVVNGTMLPAVDAASLNAAIDQALAASGGVLAPVVEPTLETTAEAASEATQEATSEATSDATEEAVVEETAEATTAP
jgi:protein-disulfide isomerase